MKLPQGFRAVGGAAGLKRSGKPDLALVRADDPLAWAMTNTQNELRAACVDRNREIYEAGRPVRAVVVNSGSANCATGLEGVRDNQEFAARAGEALGGLAPCEVLTASTGIVGQRLPMDKLRAGVARFATELGDSIDSAARAILTTDTRTKQVAADLPGGARIVGIAKGSGMIHPNMATMLAFVTTDADVPQDWLREAWRAIVERSFNQVTVDGDTSPNDMAFVLSSKRVAADASAFEVALEQVAGELAQHIARDGEGATKLLTVRVEGALSDVEARQAARAIARSPLVKAAVHGNDPNWGRILIAAGSSGAAFEPTQATIHLQDTLVYRGAPAPFDPAALSAAMDRPDLLITLDFAAGSGRGVAWGCDLSREYVAINADYHT
ncbi:MAG TPA: bifunctional glutamate N-acetyltransferase/amino-acid acetyltransferase ArgJ [Trueperaceae bacterium]